MTPIADMVARLIAAGADPAAAAVVVVEAVEFGRSSSADFRGKSVESPAEAALERRRNADKLRKRAQSAARKSARTFCGNSAEIPIALSNLSSLADSQVATEKVRKGKGTEQVEERKRGIRLPADWQPDAELRQFALDHNVDPDQLRAEFVDYWIAIPGQRGCKTADRGWPATWRNRVRQIETYRKAKPNGQDRSVIAASDRLNAKLAEFYEPDMLPGVRREEGPSDVRMLPARRSG